MSYENRDDIDKYLSDPVYGDLNDYNSKLRRNLLIISSISVFISIADIGINKDVALLGVTFTNFSDYKLYLGLLSLNIYFWVHFFWVSSHLFLEWRLRLSGLRKRETLYNWWLSEIKNVDKLFIPTEEVLAHTDKVIRLDTDNSEQVKELKQSTVNLMFYLKRMKSIVEDSYLPRAMNRFDNWYQMLSRSQNCRWIIIELGFPIFFGFVSIILLIFKVNNC